MNRMLALVEAHTEGAHLIASPKADNLPALSVEEEREARLEAAREQRQADFEAVIYPA